MKKVIIIMGLNILMGCIIGIRAISYYGQNVGRNPFYQLLCIVIPVLIAVNRAYALREKIGKDIILIVLAFLFSKLLAWAVVWGVCAIQILVSGVLLWLITSLLGLIF